MYIAIKNKCVLFVQNFILRAKRNYILFVYFDEL